MSSPPITIFIPTYKRPQMLKKALESALNQTWRHLQIIVCDNASGDDTSAVVSELSKQDSRIRYICHPTNIGMLANYEFAISILDTEFFSFLSDDDLLLPCFCETALQGFSQYPDISFFACSTVILSKQRGVLRVPLDLWPREGRFLPEEGVAQMIDKYPVPTTVLFRKIAQIDFANQTAWDCDFLIQLAGQFPFAISKKICGIMINHPNSTTSEQSYGVTLKSIHRLIARVQSFSWMEKDLRTSVLRALQLHLEKAAFRSIASNIMNNRISEAKKTSQEMLAGTHFRTKFFICFAASRICSIFPWIRFSLVLLNKIKHLILSMKFKRQGLGKYQNFDGHLG